MKLTSIKITGNGGVQGSSFNGQLTRKHKEQIKLRQDFIESIQSIFKNWTKASCTQKKQDFIDSFQKLETKQPLTALEQKYVDNPSIYCKKIDDPCLINFLYAVCKFGKQQNIKQVFKLFNTTENMSLKSINLCDASENFLKLSDCSFAFINYNSFLGQKPDTYTLLHALAENEDIPNLKNETLEQLGLKCLNACKEKTIKAFGEDVDPDSYQLLYKQNMIFEAKKDIQNKIITALKDENSELKSQSQIQLSDWETKEQAFNKIIKELKERNKTLDLKIAELLTKYDKESEEITTQTDHTTCSIQVQTETLRENKESQCNIEHFKEQESLLRKEILGLEKQLEELNQERNSYAIAARSFYPAYKTQSLSDQNCSEA